MRARAIDLVVVLLLLVGAAFPRLVRIGEQTVFLDEIFWLQEGRKVMARLRTDPIAPPAAWGRAQRHPGVLVGVVAGAFGRGRPDDGRDRVERNERSLERARSVMAASGILTVLALYLLGMCSLGRGRAACAAALLAISPFHIAVSYWVECDALLTLFTTLSLLAFAAYLGDESGRRSPAFLFLSAAAAAEAVAAKLPGLVLGPTLLAAMLAWPDSRPGGTSSIGRLIEPFRPRHIAALGIFAVVLYASWPRIWLDPLEAGRVLRWAARLGEGHSNYFLGSKTSSPPASYYLAVVPLRLSELEIVALVTAGVAAIVGWLRGRRPSRTGLFFALFAALFLAVMSATGKKLGARYVLPLWPAFAVLSSGPLWRAAREIGARLGSASRVGALAAGGVLLVAYTAWGFAPTFPNRYGYYNRALGGLRTARHVELVHGLGEREVGRRLDRLPPGPPVTIVGHTPSVAFHTHRAVRDLGPRKARALASRGQLPYLLVFLHSEQRSDLATRTSELGRRVWTLKVAGVEIAKLYRPR